jgi:hypothetical protein
VFLDLPNDRYFGLAPDADLAFQRCAAGASLSSLDRQALATLVNKGILFDLDRGPQIEPISLTPATATLQGANRPKADVTAIVSALLSYDATKRRFRSLPLVEQIKAIDMRKRKALAFHNLEPGHGLIRSVEAFRIVRRLAKSSDLCLPWSIALVSNLAQYGIFPNLVLGVRMKPYAAHAWVQLDDCVLNDEVDHVRRFTPILVI